MAAKSANEPVAPTALVYIDSSALAKLYVPEPESDALDAFLRGRRNLLISEVVLSEVLSAIARRWREGELSAAQARAVRAALLADADSGALERLQLAPAVHREAERILFSMGSRPLRTLDALHLALALTAEATHVITFDARMKTAATECGLRAVEL